MKNNKTKATEVAENTVAVTAEEITATTQTAEEMAAQIPEIATAQTTEARSEANSSAPMTSAGIPRPETTFPVAGVGRGSYDLATGEKRITVTDVAAEDSVMGIPVTHTYTFNTGDSTNPFGSGFHVSFHEKFYRNTDASVDADYIYEDGEGKRHLVKEFFYAFTAAGTKVYIEDKTSVTYHGDGRLTHDTLGDVHMEYQSDIELEVAIRPEGFRNAERYDVHTSDELRQAEQAVENLASSSEGYCVVNKSTGVVVGSLNEVSISSFKSFIDLLVHNGEVASSAALLILTKDEIAQYQSLLEQRTAMQATFTDVSSNSTNTIVLRQMAAIESELFEINKKLADYVAQFEEGSGKQTYENVLASGEKFTFSQLTFIDPLVEGYSLTENKEGGKLYGKALRELFRRRNLLIEQRETQIHDRNTQLDLIDMQILRFAERTIELTPKLTDRFREYCTACAKLDTLKRTIPIDYVKTGGAILGFNDYGRLVLVSDAYNRYATIELSQYSDRKEDLRITSIRDNNDRAITFSYNADGKLAQIVDARGNLTRYEYDGAFLNKIISAFGEEILFEFTAGKLESVESKKTRCRSDLDYNADTLQIKHFSLTTMIPESRDSAAEETIGDIYIDRFFDSDGVGEVLIDKNEEGRIRYRVNTDGYVEECLSEMDGVVTKAERYNWSVIKNNVGKKEVSGYIVTQARKDVLYEDNLDQFTFLSGDSVSVTYNSFGYLGRVLTNAREVGMNADDTITTLTTMIEYLYDKNHKLIDEKTTLTYVNPAKVIVSHKKYTYDIYGKTIRTVCYVEGEEKILGEEVEEFVYDKQGTLISSVRYNTLDPTSKLYEEHIMDENGVHVADLDVTGTRRTEYTYDPLSGRRITTTYPNGTKQSCGYAPDGTLTAISASTASGEGNSTERQYEAGLVTRLKSGNTDVAYTYDAKRRVTSIMVNGATYLTNTYLDDTVLNGVSANKVTTVMADGQVFETYTDQHGNLLKKEHWRDLEYASEFMQTYTYDKPHDRVTSVYDKFSDTTYGYTYNEADLLQSYTGKEHTEQYTYTPTGKVASVEHGRETLTYNYSYAPTAEEKLNVINIPQIDMTFYPRTDVLGRSTGRCIRLRDDEVIEETISYRKVGDHATNMPVSMTYTDRVDTTVIQTCVHYDYDANGNISRVYEDDELMVRYFYDALNRLIREDNRRLGKTWFYRYDGNGNILSVRECAFTLARNPENAIYTTTRYRYDGDRLVSYDGHEIVYNNLGNPITYRDGVSVGWAYGTHLAAWNMRVPMVDGFGRVFQIMNYDGTGTEYLFYDREDRIVRKDDMVFFYDTTGVAGAVIQGDTYVYRKNIFGDIVAILDTHGDVMASYVYDAWGNHRIYNTAGLDITENIEYTNHVGRVNPFRYRGYFYDNRMGLYYLKSRYYDPVFRRFVSADDLSYLDPDTVNGLNLYAYCGNNPVMRVDPNGNFAFLALAGVVFGISALVGAGASVINQGVASNWKNINVLQTLWDAGISGMSGLLSMTSLGIISMVLSTAAFGFIGAVGGHLIQGHDLFGENANEYWHDIGVSAIISLVGGFIGGSGAQRGLNMKGLQKDLIAAADNYASVSAKAMAGYYKTVGMKTIHMNRAIAKYDIAFKLYKQFYQSMVMAIRKSILKSSLFSLGTSWRSIFN